jgi:hypothetical protein
VGLLTTIVYPARSRHEAPTGVDGQLGVIVLRIVDVVVCSPEPIILHVQARGRLGDVHGHVRSDTFLLQVLARDDLIWSLLALRSLQVRAREAADARVDVPHPRWRRARCVEVTLDQDCAFLLALSADEHVGPFQRALFTWAADLDYGLGVGQIVEVGARGEDDGCQGFADDLGARGDADRGCDFVVSRVDEEDFAFGLGACKGGVEGQGVVC